MQDSQEMQPVVTQRSSDLNIFDQKFKYGKSGVESSSSPTAMNINLIATLQGTGQKEVASLMFYEYLLAILSVSLVASVGLVLFL